MSLQKMKAILRHKGYRIFSRPYELNIVGLRSESLVPNRFDDELHVFYKISTLKWYYHVFKVTTDPGTYWLRQPMQPQGTAILAQGQNLSCYQLGLHKGEYLALVQKKPVTILRDYKRDAILDFNNGRKETGIFGIDIHRAYKTGTTVYVDKYSAGCQVFANAEDFSFFIKLCQNHKNLYGNDFTYTLIDFRAVRRQNFRYILSALSALGMAGLTYMGIKHEEKLKTIAEEINHFFKDILKPNYDKTNNEQQFKTNITPITSG